MHSSKRLKLKVEHDNEIIQFIPHEGDTEEDEQPGENSLFVKNTFLLKSDVSDPAQLLILQNV
jgi:hypothetical protein